MDAEAMYKEIGNSVKLIKTTKSYTWEIKIYENDMNKLIEKLKEVDDKLKATFPIV